MPWSWWGVDGWVVSMSVCVQTGVWLLETCKHQIPTYLALYTKNMTAVRSCRFMDPDIMVILYTRPMNAMLSAVQSGWVCMSSILNQVSSYAFKA